MSTVDFSRGVNWVAATFLIVYQAVLFVLLPLYFYFYGFPSLEISLWTLFLFIMTGLGITGGYHRYFAHRTFKTNPVIETVILFFATMAVQGSALRWAFDHRLHHAHVDTDEDPYSIKKGFLYAHCLWILEKPRKIELKIVADLFRNPRVLFQHKHYALLMVVSNILVFAVSAWLFGSYFAAFVFPVLFRMFLLQHVTWFINSLAHTWGDRPFCQEQSAVNNYILSFLTFGEGYHNYHHTFANDYRNGVRWYHFDPTKWTIWTLNKLGLASDLRRVDRYAIEKRMILERKDLLLAQLKELWYVKKEEIESSIQETADQILNELTRFRKIVEEYQAAQRQHLEKEVIQRLRLEMEEAQQRLNQYWKTWNGMSKEILQLPAMT